MKFKLGLFCFVFLYFIGTTIIMFNPQWLAYRNFSAEDINLVSYVMYISIAVSPVIFCLIADRWINAERVFSFLSFAGAIALAIVPSCKTFSSYHFFIYIATICIVPNLALVLRIIFNGLQQSDVDITDNFPKVRFWGNFGFYFSIFITTVFTESQQYPLVIYIASLTGFLLGIFVLFLLPCHPWQSIEAGRNNTTTFNLISIFDFKNKRIRKFLLLSVFAGVISVLAGSYSLEFIQKQYDALVFSSESNRKTFVVAVMAVSELSKTIFIFAIPFFLHRLGDKKLLLAGFTGWVFYTFSFILVNAYDVKWLLIVSSCIFGIAINFHYVTSILLLEKEGNPSFKATTQALFLVCSVGIAGLIKRSITVNIIPAYFTSANNNIDWVSVWVCLSILAIFVTAVFAVFFRKTRKGNLIRWFRVHLKLSVR